MSSFTTKTAESWKITVLSKQVACVLSCIWLSATPRTLAHQAPLSMEFSRQEYWSRLPCTPPGCLPNPGIEPMSLLSPGLAGRFFTKQNNHLYIKWNALIHRLKSMVGRNAFNEDFFHSKNVDTLSARHFVKHRKMNKMRLLLLRPWSYAGKKQTCRWEVSTTAGSAIEKETVEQECQPLYTDWNPVTTKQGASLVAQL